MKQQRNTNPANWQMTDGMTVYATDGTKVGTVRNYDPQTGYIDVHKGWLFAKDFYVPINAITAVDADGIILSLTKNALEHEDYDTPPLTAEIVSSETVVTEAVLPGEKEPILVEQEEVMVMHTADGRPIH